MSTPALKFSEFSFTYPGQERPAVGPVSFEVAQGGFILLTGATGSGKTTLLRAAKSELAHVGERAGSVQMFGQDVSGLSAAASAQLAGYVAQNPASQLVCDTVWHQMAFGLENIGCDPDTMRRRIAEVAHYLGMQPWFSDETASLSGGQQQLLNLASVLVMRPQLLLLDEPTAQLDPVAEKDFCHVLFRLNRELGLTVVVATHSPAVFADYATGRIDLGELGPAEACRLRATHPKPEVDLSAQELAQSAQTPFAPESPTPDFCFANRRQASAGPAVTVRDCWFAYSRDARPVFTGLDLSIARGSVHALVGGNGCGKSTLLRLIAGVHRPRRGKVKNELAGRQALLPQDPKALFVCDSVDEELREFQSSCGYSDEAVADMAERFGLGRLLSQHPYDLSGGQQQLLALAKLLLTEPDLLLLDESTKGLDAASRDMVAQALGECAAGGTTIVLATHDLSFVQRMADEVTMLFDGQAACTQNPSAFFAENLFFRPVESGGVQ